MESDGEGGADTHTQKQQKKNNNKKQQRLNRKSQSQPPNVFVFQKRCSRIFL